MRRQLTIAAIALSSMVVLAVLVPFGLLIRNLNEDRALANAEQRAETLVPVLATVRDVDDLVPVVASLNAGGDEVSVILPDGAVLGVPMEVTPSVELARQGRPFSSGVDGGTELLIPVSVRSGGVAVVRAFVPDAKLREGVAAAWGVLTGLAVGLVLVAAVVANRLARMLSQPVLDLAEVAEQLSNGQLDARVEPTGPSEIVKVGHTLNTLADRIGGMVTAEREAVADLSHRLRTPVTALRLDVDSVEPGPVRARLEADVDQLTVAVDQLIEDARRSGRAAPGEPTDLVGVVVERLAFWAPLAEDQNRTHRSDLPSEPAPVLLEVGDLIAVVDAVLGNVFAHTPEGTSYDVKVEVDGTVARLSVSDSGPGWPPDTDVTARGASRGGSTGLGLDIVRTTAERVGGALRLRAGPDGGACVEVELPLTSAGRVLRSSRP